MQMNAPQNLHRQQWARGIAIVLGMIAAPILLALVWLLVMGKPAV